MSTNSSRVMLGRVRHLPRKFGETVVSENDILLVRMYLSQVSALADRSHDWSFGPFFDPDKVILDHESCILPDLGELASKLSHCNVYVKRICMDAVKWAFYVDCNLMPASMHPLLYDPLISLFERGIAITLHHGDLMVGEFAIPLSTWRKPYSMNR